MRLDASASDIIAECTKLSSTWMPRLTAVRQWYELLRMEDTLKQKGMESYVSNNPRTLFNQVVEFLVPTGQVHTIPVDTIDRELHPTVGMVEQAIGREWGRLEDLHMAKGRGSGWMREFVALLVITGWTAVRYGTNENGRLQATIWNPVEVFPAYDSEAEEVDSALARCAHVYAVENWEAESKAMHFGIDKGYIGAQKVYDYWENVGGSVRNAVVVGLDLVKPLTVERMSSIPIITFPVGGLPDRGAISPGSAYRWRGEIGQGVFATNENIYLSHNKLMSFMFQLIRSAAQARWYERSKNESRMIVKPGDLDSWGAVFRMGIDEDVGPIPPVPIPVELRQALMDVQSEVQRGGTSWATFGNVQQTMSAALFGSIANSARQVIGEFHRAIQHTLTYIDNYWLRQYSVEGLTDELKELIRFNVTYPMNLPENLAQTATVARMLNPNAPALKSLQGIMEDLLGIADPMREQAVLDGEDARQHPMVKAANLLNAVREQARVLRAQGRTQQAATFERLAMQIDQQLSGMSVVGQRGNGNMPSPRALPGAGVLGGLLGSQEIMQ